MFNDEEKKEHLLSLFSSGIPLLYPSILDTRCTHLEAIIEGARERRGGERGGKEGWRARGRVAKKGGERKREFSRPSFAFYPPGAGARVESPLATVYWTHANIHGNEGPPWEATPVASSFCVLVGGVRKVFQRYRGGRRGKRKLEPLGKISFWSATYSSHFLIPSLCLANSPPLEQTEDCCSKTGNNNSTAI